MKKNKFSCTIYMLTSRIFSAGNAPGRSCLFANTNNVAPANLWKQEFWYVL